MKILEIINGLDSRGGAEVFFLNLCLELKANKNIDLRVISLYDKTDESLKNDFETNNIKICYCHKENGRKKAAQCLRDYINAFQPDVINTHLSVIPTYVRAFGFQKRRWKIVHTIHSLPQLECGKIEKGFRRILLKKRMLSFIGISDSISKMASVFYKTKRICTINNGIKTRTGNIKNSEKEYDLVCVANYTEVKNHPMLFDALENIFVNKHLSLSLVCVGFGKKRADYSDQISKYNCSKNINLLGPTNDVYQYLNISKAFVLVSKAEGNPISILEAMDAGLPIIAPRVGGIPDVVKEKTNGLLFEPLNTNDLIEKILLLFDDIKLFSQISANNLKHIKEYDISSVATQYANLFEKTILED